MRRPFAQRAADAQVRHRWEGGHAILKPFVCCDAVATADEAEPADLRKAELLKIVKRTSSGSGNRWRLGALKSGERCRGGGGLWAAAERMMAWRRTTACRLALDGAHHDCARAACSICPAAAPLYNELANGRNVEQPCCRHRPPDRSLTPSASHLFFRLLRRLLDDGGEAPDVAPRSFGVSSKRNERAPLRAFRGLMSF